MRHPLYTPKSQPRSVRRTGKLEAVAQEETDRVGRHVRALELGEYEHPSDLNTPSQRTLTSGRTRGGTRNTRTNSKRTNIDNYTGQHVDGGRADGTRIR
jgi:hypothetical protein